LDFLDNVFNKKEPDLNQPKTQENKNKLNKIWDQEEDY
jgi:hypothetical protein